MNDITKQRLVGTLVLVSIIIIVAPIFFTPKEKIAQYQPVILPAEPDIAMPVVELARFDDYQAEIEQGVIPDQIPVLQSELDETEGNPHFFEDQYYQAEQKKKQSAPKYKPSKKASRSAWAIQTGSFKQRANAQGMLEKLQSAQYAAFIEKMGSQQKPLYRVRVGPEVDYQQANQIRLDIAKNTSIKGFIVNYP